MIITKLKGGLGNQMFQYAVGLAVASKYNERLKLDITGYDDPRYINANTPRQYRMHALNLSGEIASINEVEKARNPFGVISKVLRYVSQKFFRKNYVDYDPWFLKRRHQYIEGYFQSEKNFSDVEDKIRKEFVLKKEFESDLFLREKTKIDKEKSVSVHIRRGDYANDPNTKAIHSVCSKEYYDRAISLINSKIEAPIFYFFSDDIEWVKKEFGEHENYNFVSNPKLEDFEELLLMSECSHNIIANSSFSWWGAWLNDNKNKIVIAPKKWLNINPDPHKNITPKSWLRM